MVGDGRPPTPRDEATDFLKQFLADGPRTSHAIWEAAERLDLSVRTLNRAKRQLDIRSQRVTENGRPVSYWLLRGQELPPDPSMDPDLVRAFAEMRRLYPGPSPLDEDDGFD